jgi:Lon-like ATP-dependent protease
MASALLSLALNHPLQPTIAMTGELTVTGKVLRIGGLREKTVAARRAGATNIIFPADNMSDWLELPEVSSSCFNRRLFAAMWIEYKDAECSRICWLTFFQPQNIKEGIEGHPVSWYSDVFNILFAKLDKEAARYVWQKQLTDTSSKKSSKADEDELD